MHTRGPSREIDRFKEEGRFLFHYNKGQTLTPSPETYQSFLSLSEICIVLQINFTRLCIRATNFYLFSVFQERVKCQEESSQITYNFFHFSQTHTHTETNFIRKKKWIITLLTMKSHHGIKLSYCCTRKYENLLSKKKNNHLQAVLLN